MEDDHEKKHVQKRSSFLLINVTSKERPTCRFTADRTWNGLGPPRKSSITYTVDLLNPQIFGKNDLYIDYCLFLNPFYVFLFVIIFVESHLTSDCF